MAPTHGYQSSRPVDDLAPPPHGPAPGGSRKYEVGSIPIPDEAVQAVSEVLMRLSADPPDWNGVSRAGVRTSEGGR